MRRSLPIIGALLLAACSQGSNKPDGEASGDTPSPTANAATTAALDTIPAKFQGVWDNAGGSCDPDSDMRVEIEDKQLNFYESRGAVKQLAQDGPDTLQLTLAMDGEGEQWSQKMRLALAPDGRNLTVEAIGADDAPPAPRLRKCPA